MFLFEASLLLLFIKHWLCDFVWQTPRMLNEKGVYGSIGGLQHSGLHSLCTFIIFGVAFLSGFTFALAMATIDFALHYHIDWVKVRYGCKDSSNPVYWKHFGLDQLAHSLTYLVMVSIFIRSIQYVNN